MAGLFMQYSYTQIYYLPAPGSTCGCSTTRMPSEQSKATSYVNSGSCLRNRLGLYNSGNVSRGISPSLQVVPLWVEKNWMLWKLAPVEIGPIRDQVLSRVPAAFLNESIIREIITGRYLRPAVSHSNDCKHNLNVKPTRQCR